MVGAPPSEKEAKERGASKAELRRIKKDNKAFKKHRHGVGVQLYLSVPDPDAHHRQAVRRKVEVLRPPATHIYGIRDYVAADPDGYHLVFFARSESAAEMAPAPRRRVRRKAAPAPAPEYKAQPSPAPAPQ